MVCTQWQQSGAMQVIDTPLSKSLKILKDSRDVKESPGLGGYLTPKE